VNSAHDILWRSRTEKVPKQTVASAKRITGLSMVLTDKLSDERAPYRVFRWVAWGDTFEERGQRAELVLHLHRAFRRRAGRWLDDIQHAAALAEWLRAGAEAKAQGRPLPKAEEVEVARYEAALAAVPKRRRAASPAPIPGEEEAMQMLLALREQLGTEAAPKSRRPSFKLRAPAKQTTAPRAQALAEEQRRSAEERDRKLELATLRTDNVVLEARNARLVRENAELRGRLAEAMVASSGVSTAQVLAIAAGAAVAGAALGVAASQPSADGDEGKT
jgi:hypothetical protein